MKNALKYLNETNARMKIPIAIVDDKSFLIHQLKESLTLFDEIEVVWTAANGRHALEKLATEKHLAKVILMDIDMPEMNGIEAVRQIRSKNIDVKIIMLTVFDDEDKIFEAILAGANGYMLKDSKPTRLIAAIEDALDGGAPMSPIIAAKTLHLLRQQKPISKEALKSPESYELTKREIEILELWVQGKSYQQIADKLYISVGTIRKHIGNIYEKIHVHSRIEALQKADNNRWFK
jgi:DNA-binding NarL/FixJ family response regulator